MIKKLLFAGALLAFTGVIASSASAATYHASPAFRGAVAYRMPVVRARAPQVHYVSQLRRYPQAHSFAPIRSFAQVRSFRAPGRVVARLPYRPTAAPMVRTAYGRTAPAYGGLALGYRGVPQIARPAYRRFAFGARSVGYRRLATYRALAPATAMRRVAVAPAYGVPRAAASILAPLAPVVASLSAPAALPRPAAVGAQTGGASYYSGGRTANGGVVGAATCAHRSLPFGTRLLVTNMANARATVCVVNDRGPFVGGRVVDLSRGAAGAIGMLGAGVASVRLQVVGRL